MGASALDNVATYILFYTRSSADLKYRNLFRELVIGEPGATRYLLNVDSKGREGQLTPEEAAAGASDGSVRLFFKQGLTSRTGGETSRFPINYEGKEYRPTTGGWRPGKPGIERTVKSNRLAVEGNKLTFPKIFFDDFPYTTLNNVWDDISGGIKSRADPKIYVVQTSTTMVERCILMTTDPGDLVLDPTCGSGTTATSPSNGAAAGSRSTRRASRWRSLARGSWARAILITFSPTAAKAGARSRTSPARSARRADARATSARASSTSARRTSRSSRIANNAEIDVIWEKWQAKLEPLRARAERRARQRNGRSGKSRARRRSLGPPTAKEAHARWWEARIARQKEIDASIAKAADVELLYDRPYEDKIARPRRRAVHRREPVAASRRAGRRRGTDRPASTPPRASAGACTRSCHPPTSPRWCWSICAPPASTRPRSATRSASPRLQPWPGEYIGAEGRFMEGETERRAAIFIGPEFGTLSPRRSRRRGARGAGRALRRADRLRLQLRRPRLRS